MLMRRAGAAQAGVHRRLITLNEWIWCHGDNTDEKLTFLAQVEPRRPVRAAVCSAAALLRELPDVKGDTI